MPDLPPSFRHFNAATTLAKRAAAFRLQLWSRPNPVPIQDLCCRQHSRVSSKAVVTPSVRLHALTNPNGALSRRNDVLDIQAKPVEQGFVRPRLTENVV